MSAWAYCLVFNEAVLIPYWVRWYTTFCERVIVYVDDATDDATEALAVAEGAEVRTYVGSGHLDDFAFARFAETHYKEARDRADWVIWADADEILYHPHIRNRLEYLYAEHITYPDVVGYDMFGNAPPYGPSQLPTQIRRGLISTAYTKRCIFNPSLDVRWSPGKHSASASSNVITDTPSPDPLKLLHYRWLGEKWFADRNTRNFSRQDEQNKNARHGIETWPGYTGAYSYQWYVDHSKLAEDCI